MQAVTKNQAKYRSKYETIHKKNTAFSASVIGIITDALKVAFFCAGISNAIPKQSFFLVFLVEYPCFDEIVAGGKKGENQDYYD